MHITGKEKTLRGHDGVELLVGGSAVSKGTSDEFGTDSALTSLLVISEHYLVASRRGACRHFAGTVQSTQHRQFAFEI